MITVICFSENGWMSPRLERRLWKQTLAAYGVKHFKMVGEHYENLESALADSEGVPVFMIPQGGQALSTFEHPENPIYILGNASESLKKYIGNNMTLTIESPLNVDMFGAVAIAPVLHHRYINGD